MKLRLHIDIQTAEEFVEFFDPRTQEYDIPNDDLGPTHAQALEDALDVLTPLHLYYDTTTQKISLS